MTIKYHNEQVLGLDIEEYHAHPAVSRSILGKASNSKTPAHFKIAMADNQKTDALRFGHAFHTFILEPDLYHKNAVSFDETKGLDTVKANKAESALSSGQFLVTPDWEKSIKSMAKSILSNSKAKALLDLKGQIEPSYFFHDEDFGIDAKARPDYFAKNICVDLKKTENSWGSAHEDDFWKHVVDFNYDIQAFMNFKAIKMITGEYPDAFLFIVVEDKEPFGCNLMIATDDVMLSGKIKYERLMQKYIDFKERTDCYSEEIKEIKLTDWYMKKLIGE